jgi:hypothetical protein
MIYPFDKTYIIVYLKRRFLTLAGDLCGSFNSIIGCLLWLVLLEIDNDSLDFFLGLKFDGI